MLEAKGDSDEHPPDSGEEQSIEGSQRNCPPDKLWEWRTQRKNLRTNWAQIREILQPQQVRITDRGSYIAECDKSQCDRRSMLENHLVSSHIQRTVRLILLARL